MPVVGFVDQTSQRPLGALNAEGPALLKKLPADASTIASPVPVAAMVPFSVMSPLNVRARSEPTFALANDNAFASTRFTEPALVTPTVPKSFSGFSIETAPVPATNVSVPEAALTDPFAVMAAFVVCSVVGGSGHQRAIVSLCTGGPHEAAVDHRGAAGRSRTT